MSVSLLSNAAISYNCFDKLIVLKLVYLGVRPTASWKTIPELQSLNCKKCSNVLVPCQFIPVCFCCLKQPFFLSSYHYQKCINLDHILLSCFSLKSSFWDWMTRAKCIYYPRADSTCASFFCFLLY